MKVKKYNDHLTKYENEKGSVLIDSETKDIRINLNSGKKRKASSKNKDVVLKSKCIVVNDNKNGRIKSICNAFIVEIDTKTKETTITIM